jgi:hypothetical protein
MRRFLCALALGAAEARLWMTLALLVQPAGAQVQTSRVLNIHRDILLPGIEEKYRAIEEDGARICAEMPCPNPYIGIESLTGPKEAWWINGFESDAALKRVGQQYASNRPLTDALNRIAERKKGLIGDSVEVVATYRKDLSRGPRWDVGQGRFLVITVTRGKPAEGTVFETADGTRYVIRAARTADEAESEVREGAQIFAVRQYWSMPSKAWIAADPEFWKR